MRGRKLLATVIVSALVVSVAAFGVCAAAGTTDSGTKAQGTAQVKRDPLATLQTLKANIQQKLAEGKVSKQRADAMTANIDSKIKEIQDFNSLTVEQKKEKLIKTFTNAVNKKLQEGKVKQDKAKELTVKFTEKVNKWDGNGYTFLRHGAIKQFQNNIKNFKRPIMAGKVLNVLDNAVKNGKITPEQKQSILDGLKAKKAVKK